MKVIAYFKFKNINRINTYNSGDACESMKKFNSMAGY